MCSLYCKLFAVHFFFKWYDVDEDSKKNEFHSKIYISNEFQIFVYPQLHECCC
jgi:hypothetical protein